MTQELVTLTIEGVQVSVPKGTPLIEAAKQAGVLIPHYCYHPSLSAPAVCRMCLVDVEKSPKVVPSCVTGAAEGMVVHVHSEKAKQAREGVLEFLLINHPLDCPICDQAGECELQNFVFQEGRAGTRYADYPKRYNPVEDFGPDILYVANRCILCTRCVRFMDEVAQEPVIDCFERGDRAFIGITENAKLDHPWAGNVVDLCPVGSLISKDFLHKARAWDLDRAASVCTGCSQGCNVTIDTRDGVVVRLRPRPNLDVNRHFMCDHGRSHYRWMNRGDRVEAPLIRQDGRMKAADWDAALERLAAAVGAASGKVVVLASGRTSTEALGWVQRLLEGRDVIAAVRIPTGDEAPLPGVPNLALRRERAPNGDGARLAGYDASWEAAVVAAETAALTILLDAELDDAEATRVNAGRCLVRFATLEDDRFDRAELVLPVATVAEEDGTYVNRDVRVQRYLQARPAPGMAQPAWWVAAGAWGRLGTGRSAPATAAEAFAALGPVIPALDGLSYAAIGLTGRVLEGTPAGSAR
jgi:NADH-quinone oxidoreductase subunit G